MIPLVAVPVPVPVPVAVAVQAGSQLRAPGAHGGMHATMRRVIVTPASAMECGPPRPGHARMQTSMAGLHALVLLAVALGAMAASHDGRHVMAVIPAGSVTGIGEELTVSEDLAHPNSPTVFEGASGLRFEVTKSAEPQTPTNASALWVNGSATPVLNEGADLMGNALLHRGGDAEPSYAEIAPLAPPLLATTLRCGDFHLTGQTFIGSRIAAEKRSFTPLTGLEVLWSELAVRVSVGASRASLPYLAAHIELS